MTPQGWYDYAARALEREQSDPVRGAYLERGEMPIQPRCYCCTDYVDLGCAAVVRSERTGPCVTEGCDCYGSVADGGLCEDCYVASK